VALLKVPLKDKKMKLREKVVLVTDGGNVSGQAIRKYFRQEGALLALNICPNGHSYPDSRDFSRTLCNNENRTDNIFYTHADPRSRMEIENAVNAVLGKFGHIDVLIHNNNEVNAADIEDCSDEIFEREMNINAKSAFLYAKALEDPMKKAGKGNMVFISSIHDEKPFGSFTYSLAKGALKMLVKELALELGPHGVRANIIELGPVEGDTNNFYSDLSPLYEHPAERTVYNKFCSLSDVAGATLFFAGDDCTYINGSELRVDGGFLLTYFFY
jgi:NAD(P)-dependent dehydrogenase (short-subunit alcohol dehydrogenase family)